MSPTDELTRYGRDIMDRLESGLADKVTTRLSEIDSTLPALITDYAFGAVVVPEGTWPVGIWCWCVAGWRGLKCK